MSSFLLFYIFNILLILKILFIYLVEDIKHCYIEIEIKPLWYCNNRNNKNKKVLIPRKRLGWNTGKRERRASSPAIDGYSPKKVHHTIEDGLS